MLKIGITETIENLLSFVGRRIDAFSRNSLRVDVAIRVDVASGLAAAITLSLLAALLNLASTSATEYDTQKDIQVFISIFLFLVLLCTACYLTPVVMLYLTRLERLKRFVPSYILIAVFGSLLLIGSVAGHDVVTEILFRSELPFGEALKERLWDGLGALVGLSLLTLPVTCTVYYAGAIVRAVDRSHNGVDKPPRVVE